MSIAETPPVPEYPDLFGRRQAPPAPRLPIGEAGRYRPLRAGILNLWHYDEQELRFHGGRLLLRGDNGTGKSKALELLLPFLLDADLSPTRLDPFAAGRKMSWNLLLGDRYESRRGYVWLEIGRRRDDGGDETWTLGCGLSAKRRTDSVDSWYFLTRCRVGADLALLSPQRVALSREELARAIGEDGWVLETGKEYRERLDQELFGLGPDRFRALRDLLLQLRRPQLSQGLDTGGLDTLLRESLPSLDGDLIAQIADSFERIEEDQREVALLEAAAAQVEGFLAVYRDALRGSARVRAADVRLGDSRYHRAAADLRDAEEAARVAVEGVAAVEGQRQEAVGELDRARGEEAALADSPAMRSVAALDAKRRHSEDLARRASEAEADLHQAESAAEHSGAEAERSRCEADGDESAVDEQRLAATAAAEAVGLAAIHSAAEAALAERPEAARPTIEQAIARRQEDVADLRTKEAERERAVDKHRRADETRRETEARRRSTGERLAATEREARDRRDGLESAFGAWYAGLRELTLAEADREAVSRAALAAGEPAAEAPRVLLDRSAGVQRDALVGERTAATAQIERLAGEREETAAERRRVEASREVGPPTPYTRGADVRAERPGAALYLLCDFSPQLGEAERAGLEAALEAAGLLDAWVLPNGRLLDAATLDTLLVPTPRDRAGTLADVLVPTPGHGVSREVVEAVLRSVDLAPSGGGGVHRVGTDGSWRLGPLRGAWSKHVAEHVGAAAREATRQRRLAELDAQLAELTTALAAAEDRRRALEERLAALAEDIAGLPDGEPLAAARRRRRAAAEADAAARDELARAEASAAATRQALEESERAAEERARTLGLAAWRSDLEGYLRRLDGYRYAFELLARAVRQAAAAAARAARAAAAHQEADARRRALSQRAAEASSEAERAGAEYRTLEAAVGIEAREVLERLAAIQSRRKELEGRIGELVERRIEAERAQAKLEERVAAARAALGERENERAEGVDRLRRLVEQADVLAIVLDGSPPGEDDGEAETSGWSLTRALDLARRIDRATAQLDSGGAAEAARKDRLYRQFGRLRDELGPDYQPALRDHDGLTLVRVVYAGAEHDPPRLLSLLRERAAQRREMLDERERELLRRHLLGDLGDHLRRRLREARELVDRMNGQLAACATTSGMVLRLDWKVDPEVDQEARQAIGLLLRDLALLAAQDQARLGAFLHRRIDEARRQTDAVPWRDHLVEVLDYRRWHRFRVERRDAEGNWQHLTRKSHAASSGGEKAVALHLPLFAAAAAHYDSALPEAPRIVLLDEAFAGIDHTMRGRCMGLLVGFDLDFMITSHEEWGCYPELPSLGIYQLYRDPLLPGVAAVPFLWEGGQLHDVEPDAPPQ